MSSSLSMVRPLVAVAVVTLAVVITVEGAPSYAKSRARTNAVANRQQAAIAPLPLVQSPNNLFRDDDPRRYLPVDHTDEVKQARNDFFNKYDQQVRLIDEVRDVEDEESHYSSDYEEESDDDEEESEEEEESSDSDEESDYSDSSSSSEEGDYDSSSEEGDESSESSEESSSSSEEDNGLGAHYFRAPKPVKDTPEVEEAKRKFFKLYKEQAELAFNAPDY
ncbi:uncharacterized protein LOC143027575 isoform X1 [Oratosquilla oratoria]|uniref:uncharacterized protein LOC143027575 isoform X1 n=1 Tax=Oratosquilla oratoria TaxID=337810 RepID=UPI003F7666C9